MQHALDELRALIQQRYPSARFTVAHGEDDPGSIHLLAEVDIDDPDEALELVIERVVELQVTERLPVHVIPLRTAERVQAAQRHAARQDRPARIVPLLDRRQLLGKHAG